MKLSYRGIKYSSTSSAVATTETSTSLRFRGQTYQVRRPVDLPATPKLNLVYRGISYTTESAVSLKQPAVNNSLLPAFK